MERINFSDDIQCKGRKLHLQTNTLANEGKIISTLFDGGRVLGKEESYYDTNLSIKELRKRVEGLHSERMGGIEILYGISARVKTVRHSLSLNKLGLQFLRWNLLDEAISEFKLAIQYDHQYGEAYLNLGEAFLRRGGLEEAVSILEQGVKVASEYADMWQKLGRAYLQCRFYKKALDAFRRALKINPSYDEPHFSVSLCMIEVMVKGINKKELPDMEECRKQVREHLHRVAALSVRFRVPGFEEAMRKFHQGDMEQALKLLQKVDRELPKVVDLGFDDAFYLNFLYGERGRNTKAVQAYVNTLESLVREHPDFSDIHNKLGVAYLIQCRSLFNRALHQFQRACDINPEYKRAKSNLKLAKNDGKGLLILLRAMLK